MRLAELTERFRRLESHVSQQKGDFSLFALLLREGAPDRWDLIVSAPWVMHDKESALDYFVETIKSVLGAEELVNLSRIVFVDPDDVSIADLNRTVSVEHGSVEMRDTMFSGQPIRQGVIITSKRLAAVAS